MPNALPPIPVKTPMIDKDGMVTQPWFNFFRELYNRVGGASANSNTVLQTSITSITSQIATISSEISDLDQGRNL